MFCRTCWRRLTSCQTSRRTRPRWSTWTSCRPTPDRSSTATDDRRRLRPFPPNPTAWGTTRCPSRRKCKQLFHPTTRTLERSSFLMEPAKIESRVMKVERALVKCWIYQKSIGRKTDQWCLPKEKVSPRQELLTLASQNYSHDWRTETGYWHQVLNYRMSAGHTCTG